MQWDIILPQVEFAYNHSTSTTMGVSLFIVVYGTSPLDLIPIHITNRFKQELRA